MNISVNKEWFDFDRRLFFALLCVISVLFSVAANEFFLADQLFFNSFDEQLTFKEIKSVLDFQHKWGWVGYVLTPVLYVIKIGLVAIALYIGLFFRELEVSFRKVFQIALFAETIFLIPILLKLVWFGMIQTDFDLNQFGSFYPLSLQNLFSESEIDAWFLYPLQLGNVFEIIYWISLAIGLSVVLKESFSHTFGIVLSSYGLGLLLWVTLMVFMSLNFS